MAENTGTIFAPASGAGRSAIAVLRLSGPAVTDVIKSIGGRLPEPRAATLATFRNSNTGEAIDRGMVLFFPAPASYTGEDYAEFHVHGGRAVLAAMAKALGEIEGVRPAEPGEFTRRAFLNGKIDLTEAEGIGDLIAAETEWQRRAALRQAGGALGQRAAAWRAALVEAAALIEAAIDFPDEEDVPANSRERVGKILAPVAASLRAELAAARAGERIREGLAVVIAGPPNAGKSSLLNALARRDVAIVTAIPGTTRDLIEVPMDLFGCPVTLIDTAGLRKGCDAIEEIGVGRALERAKSADLVLWLSEAEAPVPPQVGEGEGEVWPVLTKIDLLDKESRRRLPPGLSVSARTGEKIDLLLEKLYEFGQATLGGGDAGLIARERHRIAFETAESALSRVLAAPEAPAELAAEDLRIAMAALSRLTGAVDVEEILGEVFARFCIGK